VGADLYATSQASSNFLDEGQLIKFLDEQRDRDDSVQVYTFTTPKIDDLLQKIVEGYD